MNIQNHPVVSREEWLAARKQHLAHEKAFTKERDKLSAERRALPWVKIDKPYRFQGPNGELSLADLFGGLGEIRAGRVSNASARLASQKAYYDSDDRVESKWVAALEGEVALCEGRHDQAVARFKAAQTNAWLTLGRDASTVFAANPPSRDGLARVEIARGNLPAAIEEYRRLTIVSPGYRSSAALDPRHVLELARLLEKSGDKLGASTEYARFLRLWNNADAGLPELTEAKKAVTGI